MLKKLNNKKIVIITLCIMVLLLVIGTSVALWTRGFTQTGVNTNTTDCFNVTFSEGNSVSQTNLYPQTDNEGMTNTPYQVTITNTCNIAASYNVVLHKTTASTLSNNHIKIAVDNNIKLLSNIESKTSSINASEYSAYEIGLGVVPGNTSKTISIRSWMEESTSQAEGENKTFNYKITIEATPNSNLLAAKILNSNHPITRYEDVSEFGSVPTYTYKTIERDKNVNFLECGNFSYNDQLQIDYSDRYGIGGFYLYNDINGVSGGSTYDWGGVPEFLVGLYAYDYSNITLEFNQVYKIKEVGFDEENGCPVIKKVDIIESVQNPVEAEGIIKSIDDDGNSYVYRGDIKNNYVSFANKIWRIVRINGDGSIRLILDTSSGHSPYSSIHSNQKYVGYTYDNDHLCTKNNPCLSSSGTNSTVKDYLDNWYTNNLMSYDNQIVLSRYCNDTSKSTVNEGEFSGSDRIVNKTPILTCPDTNDTYGGNYKLKIGMLTSDEALLAGLIADKPVDNGVLKNYLYHQVPDGRAWYLTPTSFTPGDGNQMAYHSFQRTAGVMRGNSLFSNENIYPVINLKSDIQISSGDGTASNPYIIE